ncbi:serine/arginine repetitive matrix protein 1-like [Cervus elaphus]|uniref:serine/arginine repetitive matrix protein 1-like n=1 Tax=Cervus elaphus TaxID=9860 RepID=UPI001CC2D3FC|nr:serine/arginine repetitive matrix protein 1-like [Cervus elaphus]
MSPTAPRSQLSGPSPPPVTRPRLALDPGRPPRRDMTLSPLSRGTEASTELCTYLSPTCSRSSPRAGRRHALKEQSQLRAALRVPTPGSRHSPGPSGWGPRSREVLPRPVEARSSTSMSVASTPSIQPAQGRSHVRTPLESRNSGELLRPRLGGKHLSVTSTRASPRVLSME